MDDDSISLDIEVTDWLLLRLYQDRRGVDVPGVDDPDPGGDGDGEFAAVDAPLSVRLPWLGFRPWPVGLAGRPKGAGV